jgi:hypothetical protein
VDTKVGARALEALPRVGVAQRDDEPLQPPVRPAHVRRRDQQLTAAGEGELALGLAPPAPQAGVRVGALPPVAALAVRQRQDLAVVTAERRVGGEAEQPLGGRVEDDHAALGVRDEHPSGRSS